MAKFGEINMVSTRILPHQKIIRCHDPAAPYLNDCGSFSWFNIVAINTDALIYAEA